jgi:hypothetical protein
MRHAITRCITYALQLQSHYKPPSTALPLSITEAFYYLCDAFALPEMSYITSRAQSASHPVVVLVGARGHYHALIIASWLTRGHGLLPLDLNREDLKGLSLTYDSVRSQRGAAQTRDVSNQVERLQLGKFALKRFEPLSRQLKTLWQKVVKPVLDYLNFEVSRQSTTES